MAYGHASKGKDTSGTRSRNRGTNRYTPPSPRPSRTDENANAVPGRYRERGRISTTTTTAASSDFRRRYRRPIRTSSTESTRTNELDDSPIIRITQGEPRRYQSTRSRYESGGDGDGSAEKITNIRVFRRPAAVNRDLYDRTSYTKKRNNVEIERQSTEQTTQSVPTGTNATAKIDKIERSDSLNVIGDGDQYDDMVTVSPRSKSREDAATIDSAVESNTVEPTYTAKPFAEIDDVITTVVPDGDRIDRANNRSEDALAIATTTTATIVSTEHTTSAAFSDGTTSRKRKILLRKRPVSSSSSEGERGSQVTTRRRKVIKRIRLLQDTSPPTSAILEEEAGKSSSLLPESNTVRGEEVVETTLARGTEEEGSTPAGVTEVIPVSTDRNDLDDGFAKATLETPVPESTTIPGAAGGATDFLGSTASTTIDRDFDEGLDRSTSETGTMESTTAESTLATATVDSAFTEERIPTPEAPSTVSENSSAAHARTATPATADSLTTAKKSSFESRYARKKFVRKNPVSSSAEKDDNNATDLRPLSASSAENGSLEAPSRRRGSSYVRRPSVSSTSSNEPRDDFEHASREVDNDPRSDVSGQGVAEDTTATRNDRANDEPVTASASLMRNDSMDFWKRYVPASSSGQRSHSTDRADDVEGGATRQFAGQDTHSSTSAATRRPEIRPRYRVPVVLRRPFDPEEALSPRRFRPVDSSPEESEDTPETRHGQAGFRQPRTRYKPLGQGQGSGVRFDETTAADADVTSPEATTWSYQYRTRPYSRRPTTSTSTEATVTETLIPAKKFDYAADAIHRKQQALRTTTTTPRSGDSLFDSQNLVDTDYVGSTTTKPLVTRLVTSVTESGTTERQRILIKTKYSSLTSTTRIPADYFTPTTTPLSSDGNDESVNEIRPGSVERSTLPIESEFSYRRGRFATTESYGSSTIEIESVFSNLIADRSTAN